MIVFLSLFVGLLKLIGSEGAYPTIADAGFHHNALLYVHQMYSPDQLSMWLTGEFQSRQSRRVIFDTVTILSQHTASGASTEYSTNKQDWLWFLEKTLFGSHGILSNLSQSLIELEIRREKLQIIVMLPYVDPIGQTKFSSEWDFSVQNHRRQAIEWYMDRIIQGFQSYSNLYLWGIYLMREDIIPGINEQVILETSHIVHSHNLRLLWIPYASALNWQN